MKTLLQINTVVNRGSTGRIAEEIGNFAMQSGWNSYIAYGRQQAYSQSNLIHIGNLFDCYMHVLQTRLFDRHGLGSKKATMRFIEQIETLSPDIIHLHNIHGYYLNYTILFDYLSEMDIPIIWTLHDCWSFTGHCPYFDFVKCNKWKSKCYGCIQTRKYPTSWFGDRSEENFIDKKVYFNKIKNLTLVPVSNWLNNLIKDSFLSGNKTMVIHNGIDLNTFFPRPSIKDKLELQTRFVILGVANIWEERKGLDDFMLLSNKVSSDVIIILIGLSKKQIQKIPNNIIGLERTDSLNQLAEYYSSADLFVNLTKEDNFPTTNIESLACGTPVLTYRTGGSIESITSEVGFVVEKGDIDGILAAIQIVKTNGKEKYISICREHAILNYRNNQCFNRYIDLYNSLLLKKQLRENIYYNCYF